MKYYFWLIAPIIMFVIMMGALVFIALQQDKRTVMYNCSLAEISPDFPIEVRNECRKRMKQ